MSFTISNQVIAGTVVTFIAIHAIGPAAARDGLSLVLPIDCQIGVLCFVQNYFDHDRSVGVSDYRCGVRSYDGHTGTDIRLINREQQEAGVRVVAAASGTVVATRDGMNDVSTGQNGRASVANRECGNGVILDHGGGWLTQYCHLAKGSVAVTHGTRVVEGSLLGRVGLSGDTEFYHLHFGVKRDGRAIDPFAYSESEAGCGKGESLWAEAARSILQYRPTEIVTSGFSSTPPDEDTGSRPITSESGNLLAFVRIIGLQSGDRQSLTILDPTGREFARHEPSSLDKNKAQYLILAGKKRSGAKWQPGSYTAKYELRRQDQILLSREFALTVEP